MHLLKIFLRRLFPWWQQKTIAKAIPVVEGFHDEEISTLEDSQRSQFYPLISQGYSDRLPEYQVHSIRTDKGLMEDFFHDHLKSAGMNGFRDDIKIQIREKSYIPDLAFIDIESGKHIAIEIDEPYTLTQDGFLIPIHFKGQDEIRNNILVENGWTVIRFAEEQIARYPKDCVEFLIAHIKGVSSPQVAPLSQWTEEEANQMIQDKYRDKYLPITISDFNNRSHVSKYSFRSFKITAFWPDHKGIKICLGARRCIVSQHDFLEALKRSVLWEEIPEAVHRDSFEAIFLIFRFLPGIFNMKLEAYGNVNQGYFNVRKEHPFHIVVEPSSIPEVREFWQKIP